jgi:hypothetical protein
MNFLSQRDMVAGSLLMDEQRVHRHDAPARRTSCGSEASAARGSDDGRENPAPVTTGLVGSTTRAATLHCRGCGRRWGTHTTDRAITGGGEHQSTWEDDLCGACAWDHDCPVPRAA